MNALEYAQELIRFDSTSILSNAEVSDYVEQVLKNLGCETERIEHTDGAGVPKVNIIGRKGSGTGGVAYFGHTDVVPTDSWSIPEHGPFEPTVRDGKLFGRGSTDMKGSIACMFAALESISNEDLKAPVYISCTADEELDHRGAIEIAQRSEIYKELTAGKAHGIVGEATSLDVVYAHKGGCQVVVTSHGKASHSSTREGLNANWAMIPFLQEAKAIYEETETDEKWLDDEFNPPTVCMNIGINDHTAAVNITPPQSICTLCFRPMPGTDVEAILHLLKKKADELKIEFNIRSQNPAFRRDPNSDFAQKAAKISTGHPPKTVAYGSEASNFTEVENLILLGPGNITEAHKSDEWITLAQLERGQDVYAELIREYCL